MKRLFKSLTILIVLLSSISTTLANDVVLYVTRHGKTMFNNTHRVQGWSDTPLTKDGITVAEQLGRGLKGIPFIAVYASDLGRARQTARVALEAKGDTQINIIELPGLRETCFGVFEGDLDPNMWTPAAQHLGYASDEALMQDFAARKIGMDKMMNALKAVDTSGESEDYATVKKRMLDSLTMIAKDAQAKGGGNVLVVSHGMAIIALVNDMLDQPANKGLQNASVTKIRYTDAGKFVIESFDDMSFVEKGKQQ
ncbi:histidine phosphatase family protein [Utexia brackfieldae]|uniref:histidine phosphatase family protein n=1 Tax=Utexia brackfieldae TaxID=3074108 RepID=UPI00370D8231